MDSTRNDFERTKIKGSLCIVRDWRKMILGVEWTQESLNGDDDGLNFTATIWLEIKRNSPIEFSCCI